MTMPPPDTFLIDIGRVLLDFDFEPALARLIPADCPDPRARMMRLMEKKDEFEAGGISAGDYTTWALGVLGSPATPEEFRDAWLSIFKPVPAMWETVRRLSAAGHRLLVFSNTNSIHCPWVFGAFPGFDLFPEKVLSFEAGSIKPHPAIYQHAIDVFGVDPARTCYVDDLPENIATGVALGFRCFQYDMDDHAAFERWLAAEMAGSV